MDNIFKDSRFTKLVNDPRYRQVPKSERKVKVDKRFESMFNNDRFKVKYTVDKRGKPLVKSSSEDLKKYYQMNSDSEDDDSDEEKSGEESNEEKDDAEDDRDNSLGRFVRRPRSDEDEQSDEEETGLENEKSDIKPGKIPLKIKEKLLNSDIDYARGEGTLLSDSSSDEESSVEENDDDLEHEWGELDADAERTDEITPRLAVCNMDWDNIKAVDLYVLFTSFLPPGGSIESVIIYPSEFGLKRIEEEELRGPKELVEKKLDDTTANSDTETNDEGSKYHMEKLRQYQLNRLKYFYAVVAFDSEHTANKIYTDCDGIEYESSAAKLDLRFIPNDTDFDQKPHDECYELPDVNRYKPRLFTTTALQQARVHLTWDASNPHRSEILKSAADGDVNDEDLRNYLACSSSEDEEQSDVSDEEPEEKNMESKTNSDPISKYKMLLEEIEQTEVKKKNKDVEMEITWGLGLKEKTTELVKKKLTKGNKLTPFEEMIEKQKQKKKEKRLEKKKSKDIDSANSDENYSSDEIPSDVDMNDPYFAEEFDKPEFKNSKTKQNRKNKDKNDSEPNEDDAKKQAELELLLDDDQPKVSHFSLKKIQNAENELKSKKKWKKKNKTEVQEESNVSDFNINVNDDRFSALFTSHHFNIDPTDPNFKKTKAMDKLIDEKLKRRPKESDIKADDTPTKKPKLDHSINLLVKSLKRKTESNMKK